VSSTDLVSFASRRWGALLSENWDLEFHEMPGLSAFPQDIYLVQSKQTLNDPGLQWLSGEIESICEEYKTPPNSSS